MDPYVAAFIKTKVVIDAAARAFIDGKEVEVIISGGTRKIQLPISKILYSFDDLKRAGARCDVVTLFSLAKAGAEGRWRENIQERSKRDIPSNVYVANARTINKALAEGKTPPPAKWVGRQRDQITEVRDTIDEVVEDMRFNRWRTEFSRGGRAKRKKP